MNSEVNTTAMNAGLNARNDLPQESADALIKSMKDAVRDTTGLEISVEREMLPLKDGEINLSMFVVTLPSNVTPEQRAELNDLLNEVGPLFRYADQRPVRRR